MMGPQVLNSFNAQVIQFLLVAKYMVAPSHAATMLYRYAIFKTYC